MIGKNNQERSNYALNKLLAVIRNEWPDVGACIVDFIDQPVRMLFGGNRGNELFVARYFPAQKQYKVQKAGIPPSFPPSGIKPWKKVCHFKAPRDFPGHFEAWISPCLLQIYKEANHYCAPGFRIDGRLEYRHSSRAGLMQFGVTPEETRRLFYRKTNEPAE